MTTAYRQQPPTHDWLCMYDSIYMSSTALCCISQWSNECWNK